MSVANEWERKLRAATCKWCAIGQDRVTLDTRQHMLSKENGGKFEPCTSKHVELLPLIEQAHLAGQLQQKEADEALKPLAKYLNAINDPKFREGYETGWNDYHVDIRNAPLPPASQEALERLLHDATMKEHSNHTQFANDIYAILIDPLEGSFDNEADLFYSCLRVAAEQREQIHNFPDKLAAEVRSTEARARHSVYNICAQRVKETDPDAMEDFMLAADEARNEA